MIPPDDLRAVVGDVFPLETIDHVAPAVGGTLLLTDRHLILVRAGANYRPSSGVRSWPLDKKLRLVMGMPFNTQRALRISSGNVTELISLFVTADQEADMKVLLMEARRRAFGA